MTDTQDELTPYGERMIRTLAFARQVIHFYWAHTAGDEDANGKVSIENLQHIVERMTQVPIYKHVMPFPGTNLRGLFERYAGRIGIYVREGMPDAETRYIAVKEMSHALADVEAEYCPSGVETIRQITKYQGLQFDGGETSAMLSERYSELLALTLLYSPDFREVDHRAIYVDKTTTVGEIAAKRGVPANLVVAALQKDYMESFSSAWTYADNHMPPEAEMELPPMPNKP